MLRTLNKILIMRIKTQLENS